MKQPSDKRLARLKTEASRLRAVVCAVHNALGESEHSDDESLPGVVAQVIRDRDERIAELETAVGSDAAKLRKVEFEFHRYKRIRELEDELKELRAEETKEPF